MDYNTSRSTLIFKEYGRNIQELINNTVDIERPEKRQQVADYIVSLMSQMNPQFRNIEQYRQKLWDHLFKISMYKLEVESPYPIKDGDLIDLNHQRLEYPQSKLKFKHYGKNVETLIKKAISMKDREKQIEFTKVIGNYMKMVYKNWNQEHVDDDTIIEDLKILSGNKLVLAEDSNLDKLSRSNRNKSRHSNGKSSNYGSKNSKGKYARNNNNNNNNNRNKNKNNNYRKKKRF